MMVDATNMSIHARTIFTKDGLPWEIKFWLEWPLHRVYASQQNMIHPNFPCHANQIHCSGPHICEMLYYVSTLNIECSVTYYLELCNAITIYCISQF